MSAPATGSFLETIETIRRRARAHMEKGAVTEGYQAPLDTVLRLLNEALATEIVCVLRYKRHYYICLLYTSPSPRDLSTSRMPSSA